MVDRLTLAIVVQRLVLLWIGPACEASSLGLTVHVVPLQSDGGQSVGNICSIPLFFYVFFLLGCGNGIQPSFSNLSPTLSSDGCVTSSTFWTQVVNISKLQ